MTRRADRRALAVHRAANLPADTLEAQRRGEENGLLRGDGSLGAVQAEAIREHRDEPARGEQSPAGSAQREG